MMDGHPDRNRRTRPFHLASGILIAAFLAVHMANHLMMFAGQQAHIAMMEAVRPFYRNLFAESLLMLTLAFQIGSGLAMIWRTRGDRRGPIGWVQAMSGLILLLFIANHVIAVWIGRIVLGLDTNYHFAAAGFHAGLSGFFIPYYFLGVSAVFVHLACALSWRLRTRTLPMLVALTGIALGAGFVGTMAGDAEIPAQYLESYR